MGNFILKLPENIKDSLVRTNQEYTGDIDTIFLLILTSDHKGVDQDFIHNVEDNDDSTMYDINMSESGSCSDKETTDIRLDNKEAGGTEKAWK